MITWTLSEQQADVVLNALAQRPFAEVTNLIQEMLKQANAQRQAAPSVEPTP
jgi:hypothetical protein